MFTVSYNVHVIMNGQTAIYVQNEVLSSASLGNTYFIVLLFENWFSGKKVKDLCPSCFLSTI